MNPEDTTMNKKFVLFAAGTVLAAVLAAPVFSAPFLTVASKALHSSDREIGGVRLVSDDHKGGWLRMWRHGDDEDDDDDDDGGYRAGGNNPAPMGTVAPPENGLFNKGSKPQVQVN
jgi:hypothetical protein